jgi:hypothetical protein
MKPGSPDELMERVVAANVRVVADALEALDVAEPIFAVAFWPSYELTELQVSHATIATRADRQRLMASVDDPRSLIITVWNANEYSIDLEPASPSTLDPEYDTIEQEVARWLDALPRDPPEDPPRLVAVEVARAINQSPPASIVQDDPFIVFVLDPDFDDRLLAELASIAPPSVLERLRELDLWTEPRSRLEGN